MEEAKRLRIYNAGDPAWILSNAPSAYLSHPYSKYGTHFRLPAFSSATDFKVICAFCGEGEDSGLHLTRDCNALPKALSDSRADLIEECGSWERLRLADNDWVSSHPAQVTRILQWMQIVYKKRCEAPQHNRRLYFHTDESPTLANLAVPVGKVEIFQAIDGSCSGCGKSFLNLKAHLARNKNCPSAKQYRRPAITSNTLCRVPQLFSCLYTTS